MPASLHSALKQLEHVERLRLLRNWLVGLGVAAICLAATFITSNVSNPKWWSNSFAALRAHGYFLPLVLPSFVIGLLLLGAGMIAAVVLHSREKNIP